MKNSDTVELLKECDAGVKMAVASFDDVLERIRNSDMKDLLQKSKASHEELGGEIHSLLDEHNSGEKDPNPVAKTMSWMKTASRDICGRLVSMEEDLCRDLREYL